MTETVTGADIIATWCHGLHQQTRRTCPGCTLDAGRVAAVDKAVITHCPQGHPYTDDNLRITSGRRYCRTCGKARALAWRAAHPDRSMHRGCAAPQHDTAAAYDTYRCRCPKARAASSRARKTRRARELAGQRSLIPPTGTARRLQALAAISYSVEDIAAGTGIRPSYIGRLQHTARPVHRHTAGKVAAFYDQHADHPGPSPRAVIYARRNQWLTPLWWDDDTIDDPSHDPVVDDMQSKETTRRTQPGRPPLTLSGHVDPVVVERLTSGINTHPATTAELYTAYVHIRTRGTSPSRAATRLHLSSTARTLFATTYRQHHDTPREDVA